MIKHCAEFREANAELLEKAEELGRTETDCAHDFWLTRNGHGVGFWDRDLGEVGDKLTKACEYTEVDLYVGDDNKLYIS